MTVSPGGTERVVHGAVRRRAGERLDVGVDRLRRDAVGRERFGGAAAGQRLDDVHILDAFVIALVGVAAVGRQLDLVVQDLRLGQPAAGRIGIAFGVDVLEHRAERLAHRLRRLAFGRDQDQLARLPLGLIVDEVVDGRVEGREWGVEKVEHIASLAENTEESARFFGPALQAKMNSTAGQAALVVSIAQDGTGISNVSI